MTGYETQESIRNALKALEALIIPLGHIMRRKWRFQPEIEDDLLEFRLKRAELAQPLNKARFPQAEFDRLNEYLDRVSPGTLCGPGITGVPEIVTALAALQNLRDDFTRGLYVN